MVLGQIDRLNSWKSDHLASMQLGKELIQRGKMMVATAKEELEKVSGLEATGEKGSKADTRWLTSTAVGTAGQIEEDLRYWESTLRPLEPARDGNLGEENSADEVSEEE
jgi:hypothetical protein